jgi:hypothetical protein
MKKMKPSAEEIYEMTAAFGPGANVVNIQTGETYRTPGRVNPALAAFPELAAELGLGARPVNTLRRQRAASTLNKIEAGATVSFPYNGQTFTAKVGKINTTTATVTITAVEGRSNNPRQRPILPGAKGVRVPASILARSL